MRDEQGRRKVSGYGQAHIRDWAFEEFISMPPWNDNSSHMRVCGADFHVDEKSTVILLLVQKSFLLP